MIGIYNILNLDAPIIPSRSAAGFTLKTNIEAIFGGVSNVEVWNKDMGQLSSVIANTTGWVLFSPKPSSAGAFMAGDQYFYGGGAVQLCFSVHGELKSIGLGRGYRGKLFNEIAVGDNLAQVLKFFKLQYDPNDEVHYPADESGVFGIEFSADELPLPEAPNQKINAIFIK